MPINIPNKLPAKARLEAENIFVMTETRATTQDIRPLKIAVLNLMPTKIATETQLLRLLGNIPIQVDIELIGLDTHTPQNTSQEHLLAFYKPFSAIKHQKFDGFIITGAPVELLDFEEVDYWDELCEIMDWTLVNVQSTFHICWGAQAGLYRHYGIDKIPLSDKLSGVYSHTVLNSSETLLRGFDDVFLSPHSRWTTISEQDLQNCSELEVVATSDIAGAHIITARGGRQIFVCGHMEYDADTLAGEYFRDLGKNENPKTPHNYFENNNPKSTPKNTWRAHANLLFSNWLNYHVYQATPYDLSLLDA
jgi:homoserine O-succinyltransferase